MSKLVDLTGQRFERLLVLERVENNKYGRAQWMIRCDCSTIKIVLGNSILSRLTRSCGCMKSELTATRMTGKKHGLKHGHTGKGVKASPTYTSWQNMKSRCLDPNATGYERYGGAGVTVCDRWLESFDNFLADMGERPAGTTLGRFGDTGPYEKSNCAWQTPVEQGAEQRKKRLLQPRKKKIIEQIAA